MKNQQIIKQINDKEFKKIWNSAKEDPNLSELKKSIWKNIEKQISQS